MRVHAESIRDSSPRLLRPIMKLLEEADAVEALGGVGSGGVGDLDDAAVAGEGFGARDRRPLDRRSEAKGAFDAVQSVADADEAEAGTVIRGHDEAEIVVEDHTGD